MHILTPDCTTPPARRPPLLQGTNEILRLFIGLTCLQAPGAELAALAKSPLSALPALAREVVAEHTGWGAPRVGGLHPTLAKEAAALGVAVAQFRQGVRALLSRHGSRIADPGHQLQVARLANGAAELYAWMAVLSRASAALTEGTPHADHEGALARAFVGRAQERLAALHVGILNGEAHNGDAAAYAIARDVLAAGRCLAAHPLRV
jgi:acyl-CoA dehydrogenase family member 9